MQFITRYWAQIRAYLAGLSLSGKAAAGMTVVLLLVVLAWSLTWASKPALVSITQFVGDRGAQATVKLQAAGIPVTSSNGQLQVPQEKYNEALSILVNSDLLIPDSSAAFDEYVKHYSALLPNSQSAREFLLAKQKTLGGLVQRMAGVRSATVMVSMPEEQGFGKTAGRPSASVQVVMQANKIVDKPLVAAIAGLVAGANSPMKPQDVRVIDANRGRELTLGSENDSLPSDTLAMLKEMEEHYRTKIEGTLGYINGLIVNVTVQTDPTISKQVHNITYGTEPLKSDYSHETTSQDTSSGGEAGVRPNTTMDVNSGGGTGRKEVTTDNRIDYGDTKVTKDEAFVQAGRMVQQVSVTVNVPRSYFVKMFKQGKPENTPDPDDAALDSIRQAQITQIEAQVEPLIGSQTNKGVVKAYMIPDRAGMSGVATVAALGSGPSTLGGAMDSDLIRRTGPLIMLGLVSLGMIFYMVRKTTRQQTIPSVEELAGVPPTLPTEDDLVGEADETDPSMAGVELDEGEIRTRKIAEQIGEMVKANPAEAASLVRRWVRTEE